MPAAHCESSKVSSAERTDKVSITDVPVRSSVTAFVKVAPIIPKVGEAAAGSCITPLLKKHIQRQQIERIGCDAGPTKCIKVM